MWVGELADQPLTAGVMRCVRHVGEARLGVCDREFGEPPDHHHPVLLVELLEPHPQGPDGAQVIFRGRLPCEKEVPVRPLKRELRLAHMSFVHDGSEDGCRLVVHVVLDREPLLARWETRRLEVERRVAAVCRYGGIQHAAERLGHPVVLEQRHVRGRREARRRPVEILGLLEMGFGFKPREFNVR